MMRRRTLAKLGCGLPLLVATLLVALAPRPSQGWAVGAEPGFVAANALNTATHLSGTAWDAASGLVGDRPAGSPAEHAAADYLRSVLASYGYTVTLQPVPIGQGAGVITSTNVIAEKPGLPGYGVLYIGAHYDTVPRRADGSYGGPGANDNASGSGVLVEAARVLATESFSPTLRLIAFGAEEPGLLGSQYYVQHAPLAELLTSEGMINMDCVGIGAKLSVNAAREADLPFAQEVGVAADEVNLWQSGFSDHASFARAGVRAAFFYVGERTQPCGPDYHKPTDTPDKLDAAALQRVGDQLVAAVRRLASEAQVRSIYWAYLPVVGK